MDILELIHSRNLLKYILVTLHMCDHFCNVGAQIIPVFLIYIYSPYYDHEMLTPLANIFLWFAIQPMP